MSNNKFSDFSEHGYEIEKELGSNRVGGRVTYLAIDINTKQHVVIKQFQFARSQSSWSDYDIYDQEIQVLRGLDHPGIPCYLNSFQAEDGFCMVQEYKKASPLSKSRNFNLAEIKHIAVSVLEILVYLQEGLPPVIHRDIKPENILIDDALNVYLVDFGFARVGHGEVGVSSVVKGTLGFMPPEQLFNRQLSEASDLYSLGITLICLLTRTESDAIGNLVDITYQIKFKHLVPGLSLPWLNWLEKMVEPRFQGRYRSAAAALAAIPTSPICPPEAQLSQSTIDLTATYIGEKLVQVITVNNVVSETVLEGTWQIAPSPNAARSAIDTSWVTFEPAQFAQNQIDCEIVVDTSKLMADKTYVRKLLLHTNSAAKTYSLTLHVRTAPIPIKAKELPYKFLTLQFLLSLLVASIIVWCSAVVGTIAGVPATTALGTTAGTAVGFEVAAWTMSISRSPMGAVATAIAGLIVGVITLILAATQTWVESGTGAGATVVLLSASGLMGGWIVGVATGVVAETCIGKAVGKEFSIAASLLTTALGLLLGLELAAEFSHPLVNLAAMGVCLLLAIMLIHLPLQQAQLITSYRRSERHLIKP